MLSLPFGFILHQFALSDATIEYILLVPIIVAGFVGVLLGSLCLERATRRLGSIILLFLGFVFGYFSVLLIKYPVEPTDGNLDLLLWRLAALTLGGVAAVILIFLLFPTNTTAASTSASH
ncbi:MAG: hypothetical protein ABSE90_13195 [Verrucomicrobiota bacterium]